MGNELTATAAGLAQTLAETGGPAHAELEVGDKLGRYEIRSLLGRGAMGAVYRARDPLLSRDVAIKVLLRGGEDLVAEAQAMAQLTHPNVITVHEVAGIADRVFVIMELVEGGTLRGWMRTRHPAREVAAMFARAGRGLAAAHRAGLVHGDFKPDNVLVGDDGRVRVTDFGLARPAGTESSGGTPLYMAPEQLYDGPVDARADQYSFCVALHEALAGQRPFPAKSTDELRAMQRGGVPGIKAPKHLRRVLERGLSVDREARWSSMDAIVDQLEHDPRKAWRRAGVIGAIAAACAVAIFALIARRPSPGAICRLGARRWAGVWDPSVRAATQQAFHATGRSYADETFTHVAGALDDAEAAWTKMYAESCEATVVRHEQSAALQDRRTRCLDDRLDAARALTALYTRGSDPDVLDHALAPIAELDVSGCADLDALAAEVPPPADAATRRSVDELRQKIDDARALDHGGKFQEARAAIEPLLPLARATGYAPITAEAFGAASDIERDLSDYAASAASASEALIAAAAGHDDEEIAWAEVGLTYVADLQGRYADVAALRPVVEAAIARADAGPILRTTLRRAVSEALRWQGHYDEALKLLDAALADEQGPGSSGIRRGFLLEDYGSTLSRKGDPDGALARYREARVVLAKEYGDGHPQVAGVDTNIANQLAAKGAYDEAIPLYRSVLAVQERNLGPDHLEVAHTLTDLGTVLYDSDQLDEALPLLQRALAIKEKVLGPTHADLTSTLSIIAGTLVNMGKATEAIPYHDRAVAIAESTVGKDNPLVARVLDDRAQTLEILHRTDAATVDYERAIAIWDHTPDADLVEEMQTLANYGVLLAENHRPDACAVFRRAVAIGDPKLTDRPEFVQTLSGLGGCEAESPGTRAQGVVDLERALKLGAEHGTPGLLAQIRFALAQALVDTDRKRALELAHQARDYFVTVKGWGTTAAKSVDDWLADPK